MRYYLLDIETLPLPEKDLLILMPPDIANPIMPESIKNPPPCDLSKCPAYSGDTAKQEVWKAKVQAEWLVKTDAARSAWEEKMIEAKQRFIDDAALSPITGTVKLIGIKDVIAGVAHIFFAGITKAEEILLDKGTYPIKVKFWNREDEKDMLEFVSLHINEGTVTPQNSDGASDFKLVTFYGNGFDFPFIFKRCWINGCAAPWSLRRGRYWNDSISADLYDIFTFGDRSQKTGGLDGLAKVLGTKKKSGSGEYFYQLWEKDPVAAVLYLIDDLSVTEEAALKMGVIHRIKDAK